MTTVLTLAERFRRKQAALRAALAPDAAEVVAHHIEPTLAAVRAALDPI